MKKFLVMTFIVCVVFGLAGFASSDQGVTKNSVKIGSVVDLTGVSAVWGVIFKEMGELWAKDVNSKGGIHGRKIQMVFGDNKYRADAALSEVKRLVDFEKVFCLVAGQNTPCNMVASGYAEKKKIPWVFPVNSLQKHQKKVHRYIFNLLPLHESPTKVCVDYAVQTWKPKKFGVFYQFDEYGQTEFKHAEEQLAKYGMKVTQAEHFKMGQLNVSAEAARLKGAGCDAVMIIAYTSVTTSFLKEAKRIGWNAHFLGSISSSNYKMPELAGNAAEGMVCPLWFHLPEDHTQGVEQIRSLLKKYHPKRTLKIPYMGWPIYAAMQRALELTGPNLTTDTLINTLETGFKDYTIDIIGPVTYSQKSHKGTNSVILRVIRNGRYEEIPGWEGFLTPKE